MVDSKEKIYQFRVAMDFRRGPKEKLYRDMELKGTSSLHEFAETITEAYNFNMDHAFTFFSERYDGEGTRLEYTLFYDIESLVNEPHERSVANSYIYQLFSPGRELRFLYDYGAEWRFLVKCRAIVEPEVGETYPRVTKRKGKAPPQYDYSDNSSWDTEDEYQDE